MRSSFIPRIISCTLLLVSTVIFFICSRHKIERISGLGLKRVLMPNIDITYESQMMQAKEEEEKKSLSYETIALNEASSLYKHLISIEHTPYRRRIKIKQKASTRCPRPSFVGRLSGKTLHLIQWSPPEYVTSEETWVTNGYYYVPEQGQYFIEIIIIYCREPNDVNIADDIANKFVEHPDYHRLTSLGAKITVKNTRASVKTERGYWEAPIETPLYTRWQPLDCRAAPQMFEDACVMKTTLMPFQKYNFVWNPSQRVPVLKNVFHGEKDTWTQNCVDDYRIQCNICTIGASHSRRLYRYLQAIHAVGVGYVPIHYPHEVNATVAEQIMNTCPVVILGFGQWSAMFGNHVSPNDFGMEMTNMLKYFTPHLPNVHVRSVHYSPIGHVKICCNPYDFRTPPVIDRYNSILEDICKTMGISFIDSGFITKPMWDSSDDWNHLWEKVQIVEAQYIAGYLDLPMDYNY